MAHHCSKPDLTNARGGNLNFVILWNHFGNQAVAMLLSEEQTMLLLEEQTMLLS